MTTLRWIIPSILGCMSIANSAEPLVVSSPDRTIQAELSAHDGVLRYRITVDGHEMLTPSELGIQCDGVELGQQITLGQMTTRTIDERYPVNGGRAEALNRANEATVSVASHGETFAVDVHVADSGVGIRLRLPAKAKRTVQADRSTWRLAGNPVVWVTDANPCYESSYVTTTLSALAPDKNLGMPLTAKIDGVYVSISEAALKDYGDLQLKPNADHALVGDLFADRKGWTTDDAVVQPWRVTMIGRTLTALVNSTLITDLNPPPTPELAYADWIKPGRSTWQWMAIGDPKYADQHQWVDWTQELGYEYYLVDDGWAKWKDGNKSAWDCLATVCDYAKTKNVKIWLWVHSREVKESAQRNAYFDKAAALGIAGVKIDFPPATNRWWSTWYYDTARDAAAHRLMVDFHGATKPTGMERTWPNEVTREGIRGHEWHMTRYHRRLDDEHDTILPFTRYLAGHGDYTPTVFDAKELQGNTWAHELAQTIVFTSPFLCTGGHPRDYVANPAMDVMKALPATWDETRVLPGSEPGTVVAMARRQGNQWFVGVINGGSETTLNVPLDFLSSGTWKATRLGDAKDQGNAWDRSDVSVTSSDHLIMTLRPRGGFVGWLRR